MLLVVIYVLIFFLISYNFMFTVFIYTPFLFFFFGTGTQNIINLCIKYNVPRLVFTSTSAVTLTPYMGRGTFTFIVNQTESKAKIPEVDAGFIVRGYAPSKYHAEQLVLASAGALLSNKTG